MLDGDTFELIDGRNLEMKADIIREIVGNEIDQTKSDFAVLTLFLKG